MARIRLSQIHHEKETRSTFLIFEKSLAWLLPLEASVHKCLMRKESAFFPLFSVFQLCAHVHVKRVKVKD